MVKRPVKYFVVDAFTDTAFKGNPAAVCLLEKEEEQDEKWMQAVAREFNISQTCFLTPISSTQSDANDHSVTRFHLRWFTPLIEVKLCGHGTLASAHFLFAYRIARTDVIEFVTLSGVLIAKRVPTGSNVDVSKFSDGDPEEHFSIELDFPAFPVLECESVDIPSLPETLNGAPVVNISKTIELVVTSMSSSHLERLLQI
ncbi:phenazine biosynthesis-like domain-containing protein 1 [Telopea speciosissima]|uniref:phenazine biosynthesis-like domain-containing protein 1 n=1 Tax=Telopea speciosissima TaxID=54955 RepID=UPI001CC7231A|nr:phenazine biosynthesis-like domain-containing protein 1 [Telopea speciosissima]